MNQRLRTGVWTMLAVVFGLGAAFGLTQVGTFAYNLLNGNLAAIPEFQSPSAPAKSLLASVQAPTYIVANLDSGAVLLSNQSKEVVPIASIAKLMTALVSMDVDNPVATTTISQKVVETMGTTGGLVVGEKIRIKELLYPLLLESSNDAGEALAEHYGRDKFIALMNAKANALGLFDTHFADPTGLSDENVSTAADLLTLLRYLRKDRPELVALSRLGQYDLKKHHWVNLSNLAYDSRYQGGKAGETGAAKETFAGIFAVPTTKSTEPIGIIVLGSPDRNRDVKTVLAYLGSAEYASRQLPPRLAAVAAAETTSPGQRLSLTFVGDIMLDRAVEQSVMKHNRGDFSWLFSMVPEIATADVAYANLEGPLSDQGTDRHNLYSFRMDPKALPALSATGFDVLQVANNHIGDWGMPAFTDTLKRLTTAGIVAVGGGNDLAQASQPQIIKRNGMKIGFLAATDVGPDWLEAGATTPGILLASNPNLPSIIEAAAKQVDILVMGYHFGDEYQPTSSSRQQKLAHLAIDHGATLVIGSHPHVVQEVEHYRDGLIAYSLGNFVFDQYFSPETMAGMLLTVEFNGRTIETVVQRKIGLDESFRPHIQQ